MWILESRGDAHRPSATETRVRETATPPCAVAARGGGIVLGH
jgi:hypothetical protein